MSYRKKLLIIAGVSILLVIISELIRSSDADGIIEGVGDLMGVFPASVLLATMFLLPFSAVVYNAWKKFALVYIPISFVLILITGRGTGIMPIDSELMTWWTAGLFLIISLGIIIYKKLTPGY